MPELTFERLAKINHQRCCRWHEGGPAGWSVVDWSNAAAGEMGETCNAVKKLRRVEGGLANISEPGRQLYERGDAVKQIGQEIADTIIYLDLLAQHLGLDTGELIREKFNATSKKYGFPERL